MPLSIARAALLLACCLASVAGAAPLSFDEALRLAEARSPRLVAQQAGIDAAADLEISAGRLPDPKLLLGVDNFPVTGPDRGSFTADFMTMRKIGLMQTFPSEDKRRAETALAGASREREAARLETLKLELRRLTAQAWLARYHLEARRKALEALRAENRKLVKTVEALVAGGKASPSDALRAQAEDLALADRATELGRELAAAHAELRRWVGGSADEPLAGPPPAAQLDAAAWRARLHRHPELAALIPERAVREAELEQALAAKRPDWDLELAFAQRGPGFGNMVSAQVTVDLPLFAETRQDPRIAAKRRELERLAAEEEDLRLRAAAELEAMLAEWDAVNERLARGERELLPLLKRQAELALASYSGGSDSLDAVLAARKQLFEARLAQIDARLARDRLWAQLAFLFREEGE